MPTEQEIRARALQDLSAAIEARDRNKAAILAERPARLDAIPTVHGARAAHADAVGKADTALQEALKRIEAAEQTAKLAALTKEGDDGKAASETAEKEKTAAEFAHRDALADADRVHADAFRAASHLLGAAADNSRRDANAAREAAIAQADRTREKALDTAFAKMNAAFETAQDVLDAAVRAADAATVTNTATAQDQRRDAVRAADAALSQALAADPQARAVEEDCQRRLKLEDERCDAERAAIMDRMARELEALGGGGTS
jgi:hypothetical protein